MKCLYFYQMVHKSVFITLAFCFCLLLSQAQENRILITYQNKETKSLKKGDNIRVSYPTAKLDLKKDNRNPEILGFRGKIDSISANQIWLKTDKRSSKNLALNVNDLIALKKISGSSTFFTFLATYAIIGTGAILYTNSLDINSGVTAFAGAFSIFPAAVITANVFYPAKPHKKIGNGYTIKVITIN
ncbi:hypothetical protein [Pedobacter cryophilus]|uniref:Uncharacterized protein n=1 Tax=Pedobacter cryophilus TaxID=2571271 RepID=A0A4U1C9P4_9SPHI|nr:hypothetical protein [Pedobacter cryophilus]TKC00378.1 hypothetical protein FA046_01470 [Pedobacter cryophilus]